MSHPYLCPDASLSKVALQQAVKRNIRRWMCVFLLVYLLTHGMSPDPEKRTEEESR